jgi:hypothetical protein
MFNLIVFKTNDPEPIRKHSGIRNRYTTFPQPIRKRSETDPEPVSTVWIRSSNYLSLLFRLLFCKLQKNGLFFLNIQLLSEYLFLLIYLLYLKNVLYQILDCNHNLLTDTEQVLIIFIRIWCWKDGKTSSLLVSQNSIQKSQSVFKRMTWPFLMLWYSEELTSNEVHILYRILPVETVVRVNTKAKLLNSEFSFLVYYNFIHHCIRCDQANLLSRRNTVII